MRHAFFATLRHPIAGKLLLVLVLVTLVILNRSSWLEARVDRAESVIVATNEVLYVPDVRTVRIGGLGYDQAMADLMWVRTLGYFASHFSSDRKYVWLEHFIDQILALDPKFQKVYHWAGANVLYGRRFTNANIRVSNSFYKKAVERFPDDYEAPYRIGINYYVELHAKDPDEKRKFQEIGLSYLEMAANRPKAPFKIRSMVAAISSKLGKQQVAMQYLIDLYLQAGDEETKTSLKDRIDTLRMNDGDDSMLLAAQAFEAARMRLFPYVPAPLFAQMREPEGSAQPDVAWPSLIPDVNLSDAETSREPAQEAQ